MIRPLTFSQIPRGIMPARRLCSSALEVVPINSARRDSKTLSTSNAEGALRVAGSFDDIAVSMPRAAAEGGEGLGFEFRGGAQCSSVIE